MRYCLGLSSLILAAAISCSSMWAQQAGGSAGASSPQSTSSASETPSEAATNAPVPDTRPLSGAEEITVGLRHSARNYVLPSLQVNVYGDSNQVSAAGGTRGVELTGSVTGRLALQHVTRKSQLTMDYMGGGLLYSRNSGFNSMIHELGFTESVKGRRWGLMLADRASFLPESPFGFYGFGGAPEVVRLDRRTRTRLPLGRLYVLSHYSSLTPARAGAPRATAQRPSLPHSSRRRKANATIFRRRVQTRNLYA